jgi:hypothetical protein
MVIGDNARASGPLYVIADRGLGTNTGSSRKGLFSPGFLLS